MQFLDDAPLQVDALVDERAQARHALAALRIVAQALLEPREIHARWREDAAEAVMELAREPRLLALAMGLQEPGERRKLLRAPRDLAQVLLLLAHHRDELLPVMA